MGSSALPSGDATTMGKPKLHGRAFYKSIGSPKFIVAPMVDQSEFAWRMLTRSFLTPSENKKVLAYTPMFHARLFQEADNPKYRDSHFQATNASRAPKRSKSPNRANEPEIASDSTPWLDGNPSFDRPLFVQFCANDPTHLLAAAQLAAPYCDAIDLNLGCPQGIAKKGHYGAFLQEDQELVYNLINNLHKNLSVPITAKIRILETKEDTLQYAKNVLDAGASIITVHGRRREQKGHLTGVADWSYIRFLRENLPKDTVIFANGNVLQHEDLERCLEATGADAVMTAEGNLSDPALFSKAPAEGEEGREYWRGLDGKGGFRVDAVFRRYMDIIHKYVLQHDPPTRKPLFVVGDDESWLRKKSQAEADEEEGPARKKRKKDFAGKQGNKPERTSDPNLLAMRPHLFHLLRHFISRHTDVRDALARCHAGDIATMETVLEMVERRVAEGIIEYNKTQGKSVEEPEIKASVPTATRDSKPADDTKVEGDEADTIYDPESSVATVKACKRPWWVAQPIVRPLPKEALAKGALSLSKKEKKKLVAKMENGPTNQIGGKVKDELPRDDGKESVKEPIMSEKANGVTTEELVCG
ncbi:uncharacterized protein BCR38DRAFT_421021 [Pseudomassariella vexata]|uniref:tRNA-dihydrouridine(16/17) synthase [NAD(P)(+)] n=1 Tax=Pseudomassariella vexata TaxID=1141098 RepID=A0A1Y2EEX5_9PEZI|nr:uncharacterized protein BCR38DRAFT_421021 [Pseudomassariella vexata]ORY70109.1 hypothetical protein BCR38DRAFT_421021 [Pseudomassariella vexata]